MTTWMARHVLPRWMSAVGVSLLLHGSAAWLWVRHNDIDKHGQAVPASVTGLQHQARTTPHVRIVTVARLDAPAIEPARHDAQTSMSMSMSALSAVHRTLVRDNRHTVHRDTVRHDTVRHTSRENAAGSRAVASARDAPPVISPEAVFHAATHEQTDEQANALTDPPPVASTDAPTDEPRVVPTDDVPADGSSDGVLAAYVQAITALLESRQEYPLLARRRQWQGVVHAQVGIAASGDVLAVHVIGTSGHAVLDDAAVRLVHAVSRFPPPPPSSSSSSSPSPPTASRLIRISLHYTLR